MNRAPALFWFLLLCLGGWFAAGLKNDNSVESFFIKDTKEYALFKDFTAEFGADEILIFGLCGNLLNDEVRNRVTTLTIDLKNIPHVAKVFSPMDFLKDPPYEAEAAAEKAEKAGFLSHRRDAFGVFVFFNPGVKPYRAAIYNTVQKLTGKWQKRFDCMHVAGPPLLNASLDRSGQEVGQKFFPLLLVFTVLLLFFLFRDPVFVLAPLLTVACAEILTLGLLSASGVPFGMMLTLIPTIVFIFSISSSIHILNHFHFLLAGTRGNLSPQSVNDFLAATYREKTRPLVYSLLTTALGFLSLGFSSIEPIRNMGIFSALGCLLVGVSVFWPLRLFLQWGVNVMGHNSSFMFKGADRLLLRIFSILLPYRILMLFICLTIVLSGVYLLKNFHVETNALNYFRESDPVKADIDWVEKNLTGMSTINLLFRIDTDPKKRDEFLALLRESDSISSVITEDLFSERPPLTFKSSRYERVLLQTLTKGRDTFQSVKQEIINASQLSGAGPVRITGQYPMILESQGRMIKTLTTSLIAASLVIGAVLLIIARNIPLALATTIPNITTVFMVFIFMGIFNISVDITTVTVAAVALGIAVDDTIHIMMFYRKKRLSGSSYEQAIESTLSVVGLPVTITSLIIGSGFAILTTSNFLPIHNFGLLMSLTVFAAYILDIAVTPVVLKFSKNYGA